MLTSTAGDQFGCHFLVQKVAASLEDLGRSRCTLHFRKKGSGIRNVTIFDHPCDAEERSGWPNWLPFFDPKSGSQFGSPQHVDFKCVWEDWQKVLNRTIWEMCCVQRARIRHRNRRVPSKFISNGIGLSKAFAKDQRRKIIHQNKTSKNIQCMFYVMWLCAHSFLFPTLTQNFTDTCHEQQTSNSELDCVTCFVKFTANANI